MGLQLSGIVVLFLWDFWASGDSGTPAVGYCLLFLSMIFGLRGLWGSSCHVLFVFSFFLFSASVYSGAPDVSLFVLFVNRPSGDWGSSCWVLFDIFLSEFWVLGGFGTPALRHCSVALSVVFWPHETL